ncbi:MAG: hypothetical protein AAFV53_05775 [Myxococcota bacterium]
MLLAAALTLGLHSPQARAGDLDGTVEEAVALHVTNQGLARLGDIVESLLPPSFTIEGGSGSLACDDTSSLTYTLETLNIFLNIDDVAIRGEDGVLKISVYGSMDSNNAAATVQGSCSILEDLNETCTLSIPTTAVQADLSIEITEVDGVFDVTVSPFTLLVSPINNPVADCTLGSAVGTLLGQNPSAISDLIVDSIAPALDDLPASLETTLEDVLSSLSLDTEFELLPGASLGLSLFPSRLEISEAGLIIGLGSDIIAGDSADCVDTSAGPDLQGAGWPTFSEQASGSSLRYDAGLFVGRDFVDHLLWSVWGSGALCLELEDFNGAPLNTALVGTFFGEELVGLVGEDEPAIISIRPDVAPIVTFSDDQPPLAVQVERLGLELYAALDARQARLLRVDIDGEIGVGISLVDSVLATELVIDDGALGYTEAYSELLSPGYSAGLPGFVNLALRTFLPDDLLPTVTLPYLLGAELSDIIWQPTEDGAWQGGYLLIETENIEPIELPGCSASDVGCEGGVGFEFDIEEALGCADADAGMGCDESTGGCVVGGPIFIPTARLFPAVVALLGVFIRRRETRR